MMRILVVCNSRHHSRSTLELAERLAAASEKIEVVAVCEPGEVAYFENHADPRITRVLSFSAKDGAARPQDAQATPIRKSSLSVTRFERVYRLAARLHGNSRSTFVRRAVGLVRNSSLGCYLQATNALRHYRRELEQAGRVMDSVSPDIVMAFGDRHIDFEAALLAAAKRRGIRIVLPYSTYSGSAGLLKIRRLQGGFRIWSPFSLYRIHARLILGNQVMDGCYWQPPAILMAIRKLGLLSENPWCMGNGPADIVCVDNESTLARYVAEGVPRHKLRIVGDTAYDALHAQFTMRDRLRAKMIEDEEILSDRKVVVVALPQFAEQGVMDWKDHWREIDHLLAEICRCGHSVIVSLHPRVNPDDYRSLAEKYPVRIAVRQLRDILPVADVFVAVNSSTVFWAVLCGIPVVVLDYFGLDSSLFGHLESIAYVRDRAAVRHTVGAAVSAPTPDFSRDWERLSRERVFDGNVLRRYRQLITE